MIIAVDAAGGDYAPNEIIKGAILAAEEYEVEIALVGNKSLIHVTAARNLKNHGITIVEADQIIESDESPMQGRDEQTQFLHRGGHQSFERR